MLADDLAIVDGAKQVKLALGQPGFRHIRKFVWSSGIVNHPLDRRRSRPQRRRSTLRDLAIQCWCPCRVHLPDMAHDKPIDSYCSRCEGDRRHAVLKALDRSWDHEESGIWGHDTWESLECLGCRNVTFVHTHWFSEDTDDTGQPIVQRHLYPPSPRRPKPEWAGDLWLALPHEQHWLVKLYNDIYGALGMRAVGLATMGMRTIVDFVVT